MRELLTSLRAAVATLLLCSLAYPAAILAWAEVVAPQSRQGSLIKRADGTIAGSHLIGQSFTRAEYFWPRPSAVNYDASAAAGSNLSPTNPQLTENARQVIERLAPPSDAKVPADLVSASGSGLDPHITLAAAQSQIVRVARARNLTDDSLRQLVERHAVTATGIALGDHRIVNVLELNLALDELTARPAAQTP